MGIFASLFLVKNNYWPAIPFVLALLLIRAQSTRARVALIGIAVAIPVVFFAWDPLHLKMLAYVPVMQRWVEPLGYHPWYMLTEDAAQIAESDYADIVWEFSVVDASRASPAASCSLVRRYAIWLVLLALVAGIALWRSRDWRAAARLWSTAGVATTFWLFWYLAGFQFIVMGPYAKQAVGFVGAAAPLLAVAIGCLTAVVVERFLPLDGRGTALLSILVAGGARIAVDPPSSQPAASRVARGRTDHDVAEGRRAAGDLAARRRITDLRARRPDAHLSGGAADLPAAVQSGALGLHEPA
jgi:hypothetical protein